MSFKAILFFFLINILVQGCGVKSDPIPPDNILLPSYTDQFSQESEELKKKKKEQ